MNYLEAVQIAGACYAGSASAAVILTEFATATGEQKERLRAALVALDPDMPAPSKLDNLGRAVGVVLVQGIARETSREERERMRKLLGLVLREAERLTERASFREARTRWDRECVEQRESAA